MIKDENNNPEVEHYNREHYFECPDVYLKNTTAERGFLSSVGKKSIFLAGGISGCPDWQTKLVYMIPKIGDGAVVLNPRRANFDVNDKSLLEEQITWEHSHLAKADIILFWFPKESICPISLFELGRWLVNKKELIIGCHPEYPRIADIKVQVGLARPDLKVLEDIEDFRGALILKIGYALCSSS